MFLLNALKGVGSVLFNKWTALAAGGTIAAETLTSKEPGEAGLGTNAIRAGGEKAIGESSTLQGLNASVDLRYNAMAGWNGFLAKLSSFFNILAGFGMPIFAKWADKLDGIADSQEQKMRDMNKDFQRERTQFALGDKIAAIPGRAVDVVTDPSNLGALAVAGGTAAVGYAGYKGLQKFTGGGAAATAAAETASPVLKGAAASADDMMRVMQNAQVGDDVAKLAARGGRFAPIAVGIAAVGGAYTMFSGSEANAAVVSAGALPAAMVPAGAPGAAATALSGETSLSETVTVGAGAFAAARALGLKAIPVVGGVITGYETLKDTAGHAWNGDWEKAGTELVAGAGLTLGATGGVLSYGLGEAWHAGVRDGSVALMGSDAAIEKAPLRELFEVATGVNTDMVEVAPQTPNVAAFKAAVENSPIVVPEEMAQAAAPQMEYDVMGNATGFAAPIALGGSGALAGGFSKAHDAVPGTERPREAAPKRGRRQLANSEGPGAHIH